VWAYLPDVVETMMRLLEREADLASFAVYHMDGVGDCDGQQIIAAIGRAAGRKIRVKAFPWWLLKFASPFVPLFKERGEMRYLWRVPLRMSNARLADFLGAEPSTPLDEAVEETLADLGCIPARGSYSVQ
jgi:nucleoside-diphosphate-sugar epimerase